MLSQTLIGERMLRPASPYLDKLLGSTRLPSRGGPRSNSQSHSHPLRQSTWRSQNFQRRSFTCVSCSATWDSLYEDNTACIEWGNNVIGGRERAKHIDIRKHFANETIKNGHMTLKKIATTAQLADIMTKGVSQLQWTMCIERLLRQPLKPSDKSVMAQEGED